MERWWCIDCRAQVDLNKHARCSTCGSEAVDSMERKGMKPVAGVMLLARADVAQRRGSM
jgi:hypothetical protein